MNSRLHFSFSLLIQICVAFDIEPANNPNVIFGDLTNNVQQIFMNETENTYSELFVVTKAITEPIATLLQGESEFFQLSFRHDAENQKYIGVLMNPIDYELLTRKNFAFQVNVGASAKEMILFIKHILDERPVIDVPVICKMKERTIIPKEKTTCIFNVSNTAGNLAILTFEILEHESDVFDLEYVKVPSPTDETAEVALFLKGSQKLHAIDQNRKFDFQILKDNTPLHGKLCSWTNFPVVVLIEPLNEECQLF